MKGITSVVPALLLAGSASAVPLELRVVDSGSQTGLYSISGVPETILIEIQGRLDGGAAPTTDGLAEWSATLRLAASSGVTLPNVCDANAFDLVEPNLGNRSSVERWTFSARSAARELVVLDCDSNAGTIDVAGGPFHEGEVILGVGNGPGWTTLAEGFLVVSFVCPGSTLTLAPEDVTAATIDPGQPGPAYQTTPVTPGDITLSDLWMTYAQVPCLQTDVNCDGIANGADIGIIASGANFLQDPPECDRADVDGLNGVNGADIGLVASGANFFSVLGTCTCITSTPGAGGCPEICVPGR